MNVLRNFILLVTTASCCVMTAKADEHEVGQLNKEFTQSTLKIKVGDSVKFKNEDTFFHNVFSLSDSKTFDLGSYPQGESKTVVFDASGEVEIECAIHPSMQMVIEVTD